MTINITSLRIRKDKGNKGRGYKKIKQDIKELPISNQKVT